MSPTLALIPAKRVSVQVPDKNWKPITPDGRGCCGLATSVGGAVADRVVLSTDFKELLMLSYAALGPVRFVVQRPPDLPDTMLAVVQHALEAVPGPDDEIIVLLQPSSPLRTAETVTQAIQMLRDDPTATSVVSVSPSYPLEWSLSLNTNGELQALRSLGGDLMEWDSLAVLPTRRQDTQPTYRRDGVVYAFRRAFTSVMDLYGYRALPLFTPPSEALSIDTPEDWEEAVKRLANQEKPCDNARESSVSC